MTAGQRRWIGLLLLLVLSQVSALIIQVGWSAPLAARFREWMNLVGPTAWPLLTIALLTLVALALSPLAERGLLPARFEQMVRTVLQDYEDLAVWTGMLGTFLGLGGEIKNLASGGHLGVGAATAIYSTVVALVLVIAARPIVTAVTSSAPNRGEPGGAE